MRPTQIRSLSGFLSYLVRSLLTELPDGRRLKKGLKSLFHWKLVRSFQRDTLLVQAKHMIFVSYS